MIECIESLNHDWSASAAQLAPVLARLLAHYQLPPEPTPSERLVRFYVSAGALSRPTRHGREARFGPRQVREFLATRVLLADGWPLARIAELLPTRDDAALDALLPTPTQTARTTRAQELVAAFLEKRPIPQAAPLVDAPARQERVHIAIAPWAELVLSPAALRAGVTPEEIQRALARAHTAIEAELARKGRTP